MTENTHKHRIFIFDFGSQYTQLVARRARELGVYYEPRTWDVTEAQIHEFNPDGTILSDGPGNTTEENSPHALQCVFEAGTSIFGVCYGTQTTATQLDGHVGGSNEREFGYAQVEMTNDSTLVHGIEDSLTADNKPLPDVWMSHGDKATAIPSDFVTVAGADNCPFTIMTNEGKRFYGVQLHLEVTYTRQGVCMLERFMHDICQCEALWVPTKITDSAVGRICQQVSDNKMILGLSDDVDPSVTTMLPHRTIDKNLTCVLVDNGSLYLNKTQRVTDMFGDHFDLNTVHVEDEQRFFDALRGENDPGAKHKIIGCVLVEAFDEEVLKLDDVKWPAQGTVYPNVIESAASTTGKAHVTKSYHNVGGLLREMKMGLVEPLRGLFKGGMCKIGLELDLLCDIFYRHPFPGPSLGVCVLSEVKKGHCNLLRRAGTIFIEELHKADPYNKVNQALTVFLPVRFVGVVDDGRKYGWVVSLHAAEAIDFMTVHRVHLLCDFLGRVPNHTISEVNSISHVAYDISGKPPATTEWEWFHVRQQPVRKSSEVPLDPCNCEFFYFYVWYFLVAVSDGKHGSFNGIFDGTLWF